MTSQPARSSSRDTVIRTARRLFAERGYAAVSIRDIAAEAGVSPALVIKHVGSKAAMFAEAITFEPSQVVIGAPFDKLGEAIVQRIIDAQREGRPAPLTRAVILVLPAPDPDELRARFDAAYRVPLTGRVVEHWESKGIEVDDNRRAEATRRAQAALAAATGLSVAVRVFHHLDDPSHDEETVRRYGATVQLLLDD